MTQEQAARIQVGDVVYLYTRGAHFVVGGIQWRGTCIAGPLFYLESIGREDVADDPGPTSYLMVEMRREGQPLRAPYRGGRRHSVRTLRERGEPLHPIPGEPNRPDECYQRESESRRRMLAC